MQFQKKSSSVLESSAKHHVLPTKDLVKIAASGWLGTAMEFMDFQLYSLAAAIVFNKIFFPELNPDIALIAAMGTYGSGYVARLLGAWFFGRIGDKIGRRTVLFATVLLMGIASTIIGFLPTYNQVGLLAPILLVVLRIAQGLGAGAEISGSGVLVAEFARPKRRGFVGSVVCLGTSTGTLLANAIWAIIIANCSEAQLLDWGWRIPFLLSLFTMIIAIIIRLTIKESPVMLEKKKLLEAKRQTEVQKVSVPKLTKTSHSTVKSFFVALGLRFGQAGNSGLMQTYFAGFIVTVLGMEKLVVTNANVISSCVAFITIPLVGFLGDKFGRKKIYIILSILMALYAVPMLLLVDSRDPVLTIIAMVIGLNVGVQGLFALENVTMAELFGSVNRMTFMALAKEIAGLIATGFGPIIAAALVATFIDSWIPLAVMLIVFSACSALSALVIPKSNNQGLFDATSGRDLNALEDAL
ncbi:MAG: MHS family MFS transporter [Bifidobacteriaceae bacterium]|jgi:MHS family metabolite:H+ symporter-like MFS transporter|nr:MHS family MFS transporter [Bifidobacteriaceae bacterium]